jgi:hypothetical protein
MNILKEIKSELQTFEESQRIVIYFLLGMICGAIYLFTLNSLFL